jgi:uncharacterized protein
VGNAVVHFELAAPDEGPLAEFYQSLFGWRLLGLPGDAYTTIDTQAGHGINGGITRSKRGAPWTTFYVEVEDPQASLDKANSLGATTVLPVTSFAGATIAMFGDLDGFPVGLVAATAEPAGVFGSLPSDGSGEMLDWFEVMGSDPARTQDFYEQLFDWTLDLSGLPEYAVVDTGTERGIQGAVGGGVSSRWSITYAWVGDLDQAFARVEKLGGSRVLDQSVPDLKSRARVALIGAEDSMRTGAFRDPAGNIFGIFEFNAEEEEEE